MRRRVAARVLTKKARPSRRATVRLWALQARAVAPLRGRGSQHDLMGMVELLCAVIGVAETGVGLQMAVLASAPGRDNGQLTSVLVGKATVSVGGLEGAWASELVRAYDGVAVKVVGRQAVGLAGARELLSEPFAGVRRGADAVAYADKTGRVGLSVEPLVLLIARQKASRLVAVLADASSAARSERAPAFAARHTRARSRRLRRGACPHRAAQSATKLMVSALARHSVQMVGAAYG